jgi:SPP1 gp7 family putative phage head morphogenesis protein
VSAVSAPLYQPPTRPTQNQGLSPAEEAVLTALAVFFASTAAVSAALLPARLVGQLTAVGVAPKAARAAGKMALSVPMTGRSRHGAPGLPDTWAGPGSAPTPSMARRVAADEPQMRARYVYNAARRLTSHLVDGTFVDGLRAEQGYLRAHWAAGRNRQAAARNLDEVAATAPAGLLRWVATMDERTTPDCAALNGTVFTIDNPPGVPGAVHPRCRCTAVGFLS